ncbi:MAG: NAD(+)/NADH kinase [Candidatus Glassbacteria bacterium]|nr:NAD(+)/NADH kinase [Candidatus Glassbacteria bacterium]
MNIALKANIYHKDLRRELERCLDFLADKGVDVWIGSELTEFVPGRNLPVLDSDKGLPEDISLVLALGGDGTVLAAARQAVGTRVPVFSVNLGHFGFLTASSLEEFPEHFERVMSGDYEVEERMMLAAEVISPGGGTRSFTALNDVVLHKGALARPILIDIKAGDDLVGVFPADGVIVSTPTGSTAYSLSAAGPILFPLMNAIAVTPICPHTLAVRPFVVPAEYPVTLCERSSHQDVLLTVDGQLGVSVREEDVVRVTRSADVTLLVKSFEGSFFSLLRSKLKWGERERNRH